MIDDLKRPELCTVPLSTLVLGSLGSENRIATVPIDLVREWQRHQESIL